jgi:protoporphyrin/coproporphyrin ferrochelatase
MPVPGVLLVNLGSPESPGVGDVRRYLNQFLMDERVLDMPYPLRRLVVSGFILPFRPQKSAAAYRSIWWDEGSPLIVITTRLQLELQARLELPIAMGMRYGSPSIAEGLQELKKRGARRILVIPLYPHYALSTYETVVVETRQQAGRLLPEASLDFLPPFYNHPEYIRALLDTSASYLDEAYDHILFSYHGLPIRHLKKTDPTRNHCMAASSCCQDASPAHQTCYRHQVYQTTSAYLQAAGIPKEHSTIAFQSRLGSDRWLQPFTETELARLAQGGIRRLLVICPAFVADCLETLEEIGERGRHVFSEAGGEKFVLIPCLNDQQPWVQTLTRWIEAWQAEVLPEADVELG